MAWVNFFGNLIGTGGQVASSIINKDANQKNAEAAALREQQNLIKAQRNSRLIILGAIAFIAILGIIAWKKA